MLTRLYKKIVNLPSVWLWLQNFIGATQWKNSLYFSLVKNRGPLLDFGCSMGIIVPSFKKYDYYGIDRDQHAINTAKKIYKNFPRAKFFCSDILKNGLQENFFTDVLFACVGHHIADKELGFILAQLLRGLKEGGELHFFDPIIQKGKDRFITRLFIKVDQGKYMRTEEGYKMLLGDYRNSIKVWHIYPSPDRIIKLQDLLYVKIVKE